MNNDVPCPSLVFIPVLEKKLRHTELRQGEGEKNVD